MHALPTPVSPHGSIGHQVTEQAHAGAGQGGAAVEHSQGPMMFLSLQVSFC